MPINKSPKDYLAPDLLRQWRKIVNEQTTGMRDVHLLKQELLASTSVQILLGFFRFANEKTVTIPQFLRQKEDWLELDEVWAEIELARHLSNTTPKEYWLYLDLVNEENSYAFLTRQEIRIALREWAGRILT